MVELRRVGGAVQMVGEVMNRAGSGKTEIDEKTKR